MGERRIGFLGGTFDPVHVGHLAAAAAALKTLELEAVWFIPAASPPHKASHADGQPITPLAHRVAMLEKALNGHSGFVLSLIEAERQEPSYTVDTLKALRQRFGPAAELFFILGLDAFAEIDTWKNYERYPSFAHLAVVSRPTHSTKVIKTLVTRHYPAFRAADQGSRWSAAGERGEIRILVMPPVDVSSTIIRERRRANLLIDAMVPPNVAGYIYEHGLYATMEPHRAGPDH